MAKTEPSVNGIVQKIKLVNFMCHEVFEWDPNTNINFVIGANGSGKSSILQGTFNALKLSINNLNKFPLGLVLGLFAESKQTKRYTKLGDFVQKGERRAEIQITLKNEGEDAYKPEVYGPSITFCRVILQSGPSTVSVRSHQNKVIALGREGREEGRKILDNFRINTDNPIVILQQEEAKELLKVESPRALYDFFQKATLLKQCVEQYAEAGNNLTKIKPRIAAKKKDLEELKVEEKEIQKKKDEISKGRERDQEEMRLEKEYVIARTQENKAEQDGLKEQIKLKEENELEVEILKLISLLIFKL